MRRLLLAMEILAAVFGLAACGGTKTINPADRAAIDSVAVANEVKVAPEPIVVGSGTGLAILFGAAGAAAAASSQKTSAESFAEFLKTSGIDIGDIARQQFTEQLKGDPFYGARLSADGRYRFVLEVRSYGINKKNTFSSYWVANLRIDYKLLSPDGRVLAEDWAVVRPFSERVEFTEDEMKANPQMLKQAFENAASDLSGRLFKK